MRKREEEPPPLPKKASKQAAADVEDEPISEPVYTPEERVTYAAAISSAQPSAEQSPAPVVKGYEFEKDRFVAVDPAEIRKLARSTSRELEVMEFVHWNEVDPVYFDASYFVVPDPSGEKPYSLLYAAMKKTGFAAVAQLAMHGREQVLILRLGAKGLAAHTMFYNTEVRREEEFSAQNEQLNPKEVELASKLIEHLSGPFEPERYVDAYKARVQALLDQKVQRVAATAEEPAVAMEPRKKPVDILEALKRSLENVANRKAPQQAAHSSVQPTRTKRKTA